MRLILETWRYINTGSGNGLIPMLTQICISRNCIDQPYFACDLEYEVIGSSDVAWYEKYSMSWCKTTCVKKILINFFVAFYATTLVCVWAVSKSIPFYFQAPPPTCLSYKRKPEQGQLSETDLVLSSEKRTKISVMTSASRGKPSYTARDPLTDTTDLRVWILVYSYMWMDHFSV